MTEQSPPPPDDAANFTAPVDDGGLDDTTVPKPGMEDTLPDGSMQALDAKLDQGEFPATFIRPGSEVPEQVTVFDGANKVGRDELDNKVYTPTAAVRKPDGSIEHIPYADLLAWQQAAAPKPGEEGATAETPWYQQPNAPVANEAVASDPQKKAWVDAKANEIMDRMDADNGHTEAAPNGDWMKQPYVAEAVAQNAEDDAAAAEAAKRVLGTEPQPEPAQPNEETPEGTADDGLPPKEEVKKFLQNFGKPPGAANESDSPANDVTEAVEENAPVTEQVDDTVDTNAEKAKKPEVKLDNQFMTELNRVMEDINRMHFDHIPPDEISDRANSRLRPLMEHAEKGPHDDYTKEAMTETVLALQAGVLPPGKERIAAEHIFSDRGLLSKKEQDIFHDYLRQLAPLKERVREYGSQDLGPANSIRTTIDNTYNHVRDSQEGYLDNKELLGLMVLAAGAGATQYQEHRGAILDEIHKRYASSR